MTKRRPKRRGERLTSQFNRELNQEAQSKGNARGKVAFEFIIEKTRENARMEARQKTTKANKPIRLLKKCLDRQDHRSEDAAKHETILLVHAFYRKAESLGPEEKASAIQTLKNEVRKEKARLRRLSDRLKEGKKFKGKAKIVIEAQQRAIRTMSVEIRLREKTEN